MTSSPRRAALSLVVGAIFVVVAGCGGNDAGPGPGPGPVPSSIQPPTDAPTDAAVQVFCDDYGAGPGQAAADLRASAAKLAALGTPRDIPMPARAGFVVYVAAAAAATTPEPGSDDATAYAAFEDYVAGTCFTPEPTDPATSG